MTLGGILHCTCSSMSGSSNQLRAVCYLKAKTKLFVIFYQMELNGIFWGILWVSWSGSNYPIISIISSLLYQVCEVTLKISEDDNVNLKRTKETMLKDFKDKYSFSAITEILNIFGSMIQRVGSIPPGG